MDAGPLRPGPITFRDSPWKTAKRRRRPFWAVSPLFSFAYEKSFRRSRHQAMFGYFSGNSRSRKFHGDVKFVNWTAEISVALRTVELMGGFFLDIPGQKWSVKNWIRFFPFPDLSLCSYPPFWGDITKLRMRRGSFFKSLCPAGDKGRAPLRIMDNRRAPWLLRYFALLRRNKRAIRLRVDSNIGSPFS